ncbi:Hypothetical protein NTJ_07945 [Nesidiocoris tenuis]|uniref:Uncharacterized protein n=1 Tax=Nesidiocoris tenuis TaxID=355587 RepID=A0ABN7ASF0_9HEMI|nr:Hypothetical protein NTJ_07945 [Nesidiocoris tenuis]
MFPRRTDVSKGGPMTREPKDGKEKKGEAGRAHAQEINVHTISYLSCSMIHRCYVAVLLLRVFDDIPFPGHSCPEDV